MPTFPRTRSTHPLTGLAAAVIAAGVLALPATAAADSIVYIKGGDVWLAKGNGKSQRPVTRDGTSRNAYRSPSQADNGTIVALKGRRTLHVFNRRGRRLRRARSITGAPIPPYDPVAIDVRISPNGRLIAFTVVMVRKEQNPSPNQPTGESYGTNVWVTRLGDAKLINDEREPQSPSWIGNGRLLVHTPFMYHNTDVWTVAVGGSNAPWFQDREQVDPLDPSDGAPLNNSELARRGDKLALVRGPNTDVVGDPTMIRVYSVSSLGARPAVRCDLREAARVRYEPPTWAPSGRALAWSERTGIWSSPIADGAGDCAAAPRLLIRGAGQPDWGPANP